jgi:dipeptidyl aminopeptidase/acylaminoacyl peptidase
MSGIQRLFLSTIMVSILIVGCGRAETTATFPTQTDTQIPPTLTSSPMPPTFTAIPTNTQIPATTTPTPLPTTTPTLLPAPTSTPTTKPYELITNLSYAAVDDPVRSLSIYVPTGTRQSLTLLVPGGEYYPGMLRYFAELGYAVIAFNTRGDTYQEEIQDGFCALAWAHANADTYGFDAAGIVPVGGSMWGGNAALLGLVDDPTPFLEECSLTLPETDRVRAVITLAGVFDYSEEADFFDGFIESIRGFMGGTPEQAPENWAAASAITWVQGEEPPFLLVHGEADTNVAPHQSEKFAAALEEAGADVELVLLPGINHYTSVTDRKVFEAMASYLARLEKADRLNGFGAGTFAFVSNRDGDYEIYLMMIPSVGGGPVVEVQLTHNEAEDSVPDWSPDGERIAFASTRDGNREIYLMDVDDTIQDPENARVRRLTDHEGDDLSPVWSPDGTQIAFASDRDGDWEIYVMRADGTDLRQLTDNTSIESKASWSPDGAQIAFDSGEGYERDIYVMDSDGANQERLVQAEGGWPAWSPDGTRIAYFDRVDGNPEIYVVNVDGTNRTRLTRNSTGDWEPSWSPDGEWLLHVSGGVPGVFMMRADGSETHRLTDDSSEDWSPVWQP